MCVCVCVFTCVLCNIEYIVYMYIDVSTVCPGVSWPPLSTIVTLLLRWASYCVCNSNAHWDAFLYFLVLLMRIHSELRELLSPLLFVDGSLYTNDVVLLCYHVLRECPSECVKQWIVRAHFLNVRSQKIIWGVICVCDLNYVYVFEFGILNQTIWPWLSFQNAIQVQLHGGKNPIVLYWEMNRQSDLTPGHLLSNQTSRNGDCGVDVSPHERGKSKTTW